MSVNLTVKETGSTFGIINPSCFTFCDPDQDFVYKTFTNVENLYEGQFWKACLRAAPKIKLNVGEAINHTEFDYLILPIAYHNSWNNLYYIICALVQNKTKLQPIGDINLSCTSTNVNGETQWTFSSASCNFYDEPDENFVPPVRISAITVNNKVYTYYKTAVYNGPYAIWINDADNSLVTTDGNRWIDVDNSPKAWDQSGRNQYDITEVLYEDGTHFSIPQSDE